LLLSELMKAGLTLEDMESIDVDGLQTPAEVKTAIKIVVLEKQIAAQDQQLQTQQETLEGLPVEEPENPPGGPEDTGGPTSEVPVPSDSDPEVLRARAKEIRDNAAPHDDDALREARWLILRATHLD